MLVDRAVRMRDQGKSAKEIAEALDELKARVRLFAGLDYHGIFGRKAVGISRHEKQAIAEDWRVSNQS